MSINNNQEKYYVPVVTTSNLMSGKQFNAMYSDSKFVKLTNETELHHGFQFKDGLNIDTIPFNPNGECQPGGIYFCCERYVPSWIEYNPLIGVMCWIRDVIIPDDAAVYIEYSKAKADRIILGPRKYIWTDKQLCSQIVKYNPIIAVQYIKTS